MLTILQLTVARSSRPRAAGRMSWASFLLSVSFAIGMGFSGSGSGAGAGMARAGRRRVTVASWNFILYALFYLLGLGVKCR